MSILQYLPAISVRFRPWPASRAVIPGVPHHVTLRGNGRQMIFNSDADRSIYLRLLRQYSELYGLSLLGYCLMSNHVHLIAVPQARSSLALALKQTHGRYAAYWNARLFSSGHVWQGRFYSCPLDEPHLWSALRYVELNPVRAGMVRAAEQWEWSSARGHRDGAAANPMLEMARWRRRWTMAEWAQFLAAGDSSMEVQELRRCTHTGRPLGAAEFVSGLEKTMLRPLAPRKAGRRKGTAPESAQSSLTCAA